MANDRTPRFLAMCRASAASDRRLARPANASPTPLMPPAAPAPATWYDGLCAAPGSAANRAARRRLAAQTRKGA